MIVNYPRMRRRKAAGPTASVTPTAGVTYINGLSGLEAPEVSSFAQAISDNSGITTETTTVYVDFGSIHRKISVGDQVTLPLDGTNYAFDVIGFNHDTLTTPTAYGAATATGKAGITFQMHDLFATLFAMNDKATSSGGWKKSKMRTSTMVTMKGYLPTDWQAAIKPVNKLAASGSSMRWDTIETVSDDCFLLSESEITDNTYSWSEEVSNRYAYYKAGNSKIKKWNGSPYAWFERSAGFSYDGNFCIINNAGNVSMAVANADFGVAFGFCF